MPAEPPIDEEGGGDPGPIPAWGEPESMRFVVGGSDHDLVTNGVDLTRWVPYLKDGVPILEWVVRGGPLIVKPDPYLGKSIAWYTTEDSTETLRFTGDCLDVSTVYLPDLGCWGRSYKAAGIAHRATLVPVTNPSDLTDAITFNERSDSPNYRESLASRTVGEILRYVLESAEMATALNAAGIGGYSDLPTTPASATAALSGETVDTVTVGSGGSGYADAPSVLLKGGGGKGARAKATVTAGAVASITILDGGSGYNSGDVAVTFRGGGGTGATAGSITVTSGAVTAIAVSAGGSGYSEYAPPEVVIAWNDGGAAASATVSAGAVSAIAVDDAGAGFTTAPEVWISPLPLATLRDLAKLDVIPPSPVVVQGEKILQALQGVLDSWQPNHWIHVDPDGTIRVHDVREATVIDRTLAGADSPPVDGAGVQISRSIQGCAGRVVIRGGPDVTANWLSLAGGTGTTSKTGTVQASPTPTATGFKGDSGLSITDDAYNGWVLKFTSGSLAGESRFVSDYVGSTRTFTVASAFSSAPSASDTFRVRTRGSRLEEYFDWGGETDEATIKAAWTLGDFTDLSSNAQDSGACTCPSTIEVTITTAKTYAANELDQTTSGRKAVIMLTDNLSAGIDAVSMARVTSNTETSGGTSTLTLDRELPATTFDSFKLYLQSQEGAVVWRRYRPEDVDIQGALTTYFPFPVPVAGDSDAAGMASEPVMVLVKGAQTATVPVRVDPDAGTFTADRPTVTFFGPTIATGSAAAGTNVPDDVQVLAAVVAGSLQAIAPPDSSGAVYSGAVVAETGREDTLTITIPSWIDKGQQANMLRYAWEVLDTVCNPVLEGTISLVGWDPTFYSPGQAVQVMGNGFATPWQHQAVPVVGVEVELFAPTVRYRTRLQVSSQLQAFSAAVFERPIAMGLEIGGFGLMGADLSPVWGGYAGGLGGSAPSLSSFQGTMLPAGLGQAREGGPTHAERVNAHKVNPERQATVGDAPSPSAVQEQAAMATRAVGSPGGPSPSAAQRQNAMAGTFPGQPGGATPGAAERYDQDNPARPFAQPTGRYTPPARPAPTPAAPPARSPAAPYAPPAPTPAQRRPGIMPGSAGLAGAFDSPFASTSISTAQIKPAPYVPVTAGNAARDSKNPYLGQDEWPMFDTGGGG
jgi:hypothetical protein